MARTKGALGSRHYHVVRKRDGAANQVGAARTLADAWADLRRRAANAPADFWRVTVCQRGCGYLMRDPL